MWEKLEPGEKNKTIAKEREEEPPLLSDDVSVGGRRWGDLKLDHPALTDEMQVGHRPWSEMKRKILMVKDK